MLKCKVEQPANESVSEHAVIKFNHSIASQLQDCVAEEIPIALIYNGISHAVMMATPLDLEDFALGFSLTEGIVKSASDLYAVEVIHQENGIELHCEIASECFVKLKEKRRNLVGRTGCGICGSESLEQAMRSPMQAITKKIEVSAAAITQSLRHIVPLQKLQTLTGATHASAWVSVSGEVLMVREDVGRHNALDKLIGALAKTTHNLSQGYVLTTSRGSYEMVQKIASVGIGMLVAISAPTALAIKIAQQYHITLVGFARNEQFVVYNGAEYIK